MSLLDYCTTENEKVIIAKYIEMGTPTGVARELGKDQSNTCKLINRIKNKATIQGYSPEHDMIHVAPDTHFVKGTSTLYDDEGNVKIQWVKTDKKANDMHAAMHAAAEALREDITQCDPIKQPKTQLNDKLLVQYTITDYHIGMMAWGEETRGDDWNLKISEDVIVKWFAAAIEASPDSEQCVFAQIGDFLHWDSMDQVTPGHGHNLDGDSRSQKMIRVVIRVNARIISMLLKKHKTVKIIMAQGNHDLYSSAWLREYLDFYYDNEPRVFVDVSPDPYYCIKFGSVGLYYHHGHKKNVAGLPSVFVQKFRDVYGSTKYSYGHSGHMHHKHVKECNLMIMEQHQTLAPSDAYSSSGGWASESSAQTIVYHKDYGEVSRVRITPNMLK